MALFAQGKAFPSTLPGEVLRGIPAGRMDVGKDALSGLGFEIAQTSLGPAYGHGGFFPGYLSLALWYREVGISIAVQVNSSAPDALAHPLRELLEEAARRLCLRAANTQETANDIRAHGYFEGQPMEFKEITDINAPADVVFAVMTEVERWPEWTPTVTRVERVDGSSLPIAIGSRLRIVQPRVPPAEWTVTALEAGRGFRMMSRSPGATVVANHWIEPLGNGQHSRVILSVTFSGWLGQMIARAMRGLNNRYLAQEAAGLKRRSEDKARVRS